MAHINFYLYFPHLLSDLAYIRSDKPAHNGVVSFVLSDIVKCLKGVNIMDILNLKHAFKTGYCVVERTICKSAVGVSLHFSYTACRRGKLSGKQERG